MSVDESGGGVHKRRPSLRGAVYGRVVNGQETFSKWPRKRGAKLHPKTLAQMEFFRQVQWAFKFSDANVQVSYSSAVKGTPLMPRDLFLMAVSGRMFSVVDDQGKRWWSVASRGSISQSLDVLTDVPGSLLFRGPEIWQPVALGAPGKLLKVNAAGDGLEYGDSSGGEWGTITGDVDDQTDLINRFIPYPWQHYDAAVTPQTGTFDTINVLYSHFQVADGTCFVECYFRIVTPGDGAGWIDVTLPPGHFPPGFWPVVVGQKVTGSKMMVGNMSDFTHSVRFMLYDGSSAIGGIGQDYNFFAVYRTT